MHAEGVTCKIGIFFYEGYLKTGFESSSMGYEVNCHKLKNEQVKKVASHAVTQYFQRGNVPLQRLPRKLRDEWMKIGSN